jgi:hypothetical protein
MLVVVDFHQMAFQCLVSAGSRAEAATSGLLGSGGQFSLGSSFLGQQSYKRN